EARELAERAITLVNHAKDPILDAGAEENLAECCFWTGDLPAARSYFERALVLCNEASSPALIKAYGFDLVPIILGFLGLDELLLGWPDRAILWERRTIERAHSCPHPYSRSLGLLVAWWQQPIRVDSETSTECLTLAREICDEYGLDEIAGWVKQLDG